VKTLALTLTLSPREREQEAAASGDPNDGDIATGLRVIKNRRNIHPLLGERAGVREDN
jgi:hypothetical protein